MFTDLYGGNRGASIRCRATPTPGWCRRRVVAGSALADKSSDAAGVQSGSDLPDRRRRNRADNLNAFAPDIKIARVRNWTVGFARSISRDMAVEIRYIGNRGDNEWSSINYNTIRGENLVANGFMNEFKLAMANLAGEQRVRRRQPRRLVRLLRLRHRHEPAADLPGVPERQDRRWQPAAYTNADHDMGELDDRRPPGCAQPEPERRGDRSRRQPDPPQPGAGAGLPGELLRRQPRRQLRQRHRQRRVQQVQRAADRAATPPVEGLLRERQLPVRVRGRLAVRRLQLRPRVDRHPRHRQPDGPPRAQVPGRLDAAVRPRRAVRRQDAAGSPTRSSAAGASPGSAASDDRQDLGNVRLVGMSVDELQGDLQVLPQGERVHGHRRGVDAARRHHPQHAAGVQHDQHDAGRLLDEPRRAEGRTSHRPTRPPASRSRRATARRAACCCSRRGSSASTSAWPSGSRIGGSKNVEVRFDVLNLFDKPNFNRLSPTRDGRNDFRTTAAYTDAEQHLRSGGRVGQ